MLAVVRPPDAVPRDRMLALVAFAAMAAELLAYGGSAGQELRSLLFAALIAAPLAWWGSRPEACAVAVTALFLVGTVGAAPERLENAATPLLPIVVAVFGLALHSRGERLRIAAAASLVMLLAAAAVQGSGLAAGIAFGAFVVYVPTFLAGRVVRSRSVLNRNLAERARELEAERAERVRQAALRERVRIAGELQDVVAHGVSSMIVQAAAARRMAPRDPDAAEQAIELIEQTGRDALGEMRRLLGVLRRGDEDVALAPPASLARVDALVDRARHHGREVRLRVEGDAVPVPAGLDAAAYRVLEEALAATPDGPATVRVRWGAAELELEVVADAAHEGPPEAELVGLRERVALFGGRLAAAPRSDGYSVRVSLPLPGEPA